MLWCMTLPIGPMLLSLILSATFGPSHGRLRVVALGLRLWLLAHDALVMPTGSCTAHLDWIVLLIWILRGLVRLKHVRSGRPLKLSIAHILWLPLTCCIVLATGSSCNKWWILSENLFKVKSGCSRSFLFLDLCIVQFYQRLELSNDIGTIVGMLGTWVMGEPEHS